MKRSFEERLRLAAERREPLTGSEPRTHRWTEEEFALIIEAGILAEGEVELIDGIIYCKVADTPIIVKAETAVS